MDFSFLAEINWYEVFVQFIGIVGIIAGLSAFQCNKHSHALALKMTEEGSFGIQYLLLGGYTGAVLNLVGIFRNLIFTYLGKRDKQKELKYARIILGFLFAVLGLLSWEGYISILIIFAKVLSTLAYGTTNMKKMRMMISVTCVCWICYNIYIGSIAGVISDSCNLVSVIIGIIRYDIMKKEEKVKE